VLLPGRVLLLTGRGHRRRQALLPRGAESGSDAPSKPSAIIDTWALKTWPSRWQN